MKSFNQFLSLFFFLSLLFVAPSCVDQEFDEPPVDGEALDITGNATIADLKALLTTGGIVEITEDFNVYGVVSADDRNGNFFRSFFFQDETGGIEVLINLTDAYNIFATGRELVIKCKGLYLGNSSGVIQLGGYVYEEDGGQELGDIVLFNEFISKGKRLASPEGKITTIGALNQIPVGDIATLIKLENVEFANFELGQTYADPVGRRSINRTLQDCNGNEIVVRSSGYSNFAATTLPEGNGSLTAIFSVFGSTPQLFIRGPEDAVFGEVRCDGGGSTGEEELIDIMDLREAWDGGAGSAPADKKIEGIVISDVDNNNWDSRNLVIQDGSGGIVVRFQDGHTYPLGQSLEIVVSGQELSEFNGLLQVNMVPNGNVNDLGSGTLPAPREVTVADILGNSEDWESTLVAIKEVTISGGATFEGLKTVTDGTATIDMFTRGAAAFSNASVPTEAIDMVAVVSQFDNPQLVLRNLDDVGEGGGGGPVDPTDPLDILEEAFNGQSNNQAISTAGWTNVAVKGTRTWLAKEFDGNVYAQATSYQDDNPEAEMWLVTPPIKLDSPKTLNFESAKAFHNHDGLTVWISTDFDGDVTTASWTELTAVLASASDDDHAWISSDDVDLSAFSGVGYIGFKYEGNNVSSTTSYRIDNVEIND